MRKKALIAAMLLASFSGLAHADILDVSAHGGFTTVSMTDLNRSNTDMHGWWGDGKNRPMTNGYVVGLDVNSAQLTPWHWLNLGLRGEYLATNQAEVEWINQSGGPATRGRNTIHDDGNLSSVLAGAGIKSESALKGLSLGVNAWVGYGMGNIIQSFEDPKGNLNPGGGGSIPQTGTFSASNLVGELEGTVSYQLFGSLTLSFIGGWRWANLEVLKDSKGKFLYDNLDATGFPSVVDYSAVSADFSGASAQGSLSYAF